MYCLYASMQHVFCFLYLFVLFTLNMVPLTPPTPLLGCHRPKPSVPKASNGWTIGQRHLNSIGHQDARRLPTCSQIASHTDLRLLGCTRYDSHNLLSFQTMTAAVQSQISRTMDLCLQGLDFSAAQIQGACFLLSGNRAFPGFVTRVASRVLNVSIGASRAGACRSFHAKNFWHFVSGRTSPKGDWS